MIETQEQPRQDSNNNLNYNNYYSSQNNFMKDTTVPVDYSYPTARRENTMYLSTINDRDAKFKKFKQLSTTRDYSANLFNLDIPGSSPKKFGVLHHKPDFTNRNDDIERSNPKILHIQLNKPEYNLSNKDIEFSSASTVRIHETRCSKHIRPSEPVNPLEPKYKLPYVEYLDPPVPKFIRDNIQIHDIQGSFPKKYYKWETRKGFFNMDIEGSSPKKPKIRNPNTKYDYINYNDVTQDIFKTRRCVNPLDPIYEVKYKNNENYIHGMIEKSKPQTNYPYTYPFAYNLKCDDIDGCHVGTKNRINKYQSPNEYNLNIKDIPGAGAGSLKKGIVTDRNTNPINPKYKYIGGVELGNKFENDPYAKNAKNSNLTYEESKSLHNEENTHKVRFDNQKDSTTMPNINKPKIYDNLKNVKDFKDSNKEQQQQNYLSNNEMDYPHFDADNFKKPNPNFSYIHDNFIIPAKDPLKKQDYSRKTFEMKVVSNKPDKRRIDAQLKPDYSKTDLGFKKSNAQKLDSFLGK